MPSTQYSKKMVRKQFIFRRNYISDLFPGYRCIVRHSLTMLGYTINLCCTKPILSHRSCILSRPEFNYHKGPRFWEDNLTESSWTGDLFISVLTVWNCNFPHRLQADGTMENDGNFTKWDPATGSRSLGGVPLKVITGPPVPQLPVHHEVKKLLYQKSNYQDVLPKST